MATKVEQYYNQCKLTVVDYKEQRVTGNYICSCETIGAPVELEPEPLLKVVTWQELEQSVKENKMPSIEAHLTHIINTRECRRMTFSTERLNEAKQDLYKALETITNKSVQI